MNYFIDLDIKKDSKPFWNVYKSYFSNKHSKGDTNMLIEKDELILEWKLLLCSMIFWPISTIT